MTRFQLVTLTIIDGYSMVQKCRLFMDTLGTSLVPAVGSYLSTQQLIVPTIKLAEDTGGKPRVNL
jgi:hypothetical protein